MACPATSSATSRPFAGPKAGIHIATDGRSCLRKSRDIFLTTATTSLIPQSMPQVHSQGVN